MRKLVKNSFILFVCAVVVVIGVSIGIAWWRWDDWLRAGSKIAETNAETLRTVAIIVGGLLALIFGVWRAWEMKRQTDAAVMQAKAAQQQVDAARNQVVAVRAEAAASEQRMLNEQYQQGVEMLESDVLPVRLGGISVLRRLAEEYSEEFHVRVMRMFCAFVRRPADDYSTPAFEETSLPSDGRRSNQSRLRQDVQDVMEAICARGAERIKLEENDPDFNLDLSGARLQGLRLQHPETANLSGAWMSGIDLRGVWLAGADLSGARCWEDGDFTGTVFHGANLSGARFEESKMVGTKFNGNQNQTNMENASFNGSDLTDAKMWHTRMKGVQFIGTNISGIEFSLNSALPAEGLRSRQFFGTQVETKNRPDVRGVTNESTEIPLEIDYEFVRLLDSSADC